MALQPLEVRLQPLQDKALQGDVAARSLLSEGGQVFVGSEVAAGVDKRAIEPVAFLQVGDLRAQFERSQGSDQAA